jgi:DNA polymerase-3 subunit delta'
MSLDWLDPARQQFRRLSENLPHALLIHGERGVGKSTLAMEIVASLLCDSSGQGESVQQACGQCRNCNLFESGNHPDFHYLSSELFVEDSQSAHLSYAERYLEDETKRRKRKSRKVISVDQIRTLISDFALSQHSAEHKVALVQPAEAMNTNAANALLKLLEEPNPDSILLLVSSDPSRLPMTIRSRCVCIGVKLPESSLAVKWLAARQVEEITARKAMAIAGGAPITALHYVQSGDIERFEQVLTILQRTLHAGMGPIQAREALIKSNRSTEILSWLKIVTSWLIQLSTSQSHTQESAAWWAFKPELLNILNGLAQAELGQLFRSYDDLTQLAKQDTDVINLGLALDKWLIALKQGLLTKRA